MGCVAINGLCCAADISISDVQQKLPLSAFLLYRGVEEHCVHFCVCVSHIYLPTVASSIKVSGIIYHRL